MKTVVQPDVEKDLELSEAVKTGNRYFNSIESRFKDDVSVEWGVPTLNKFPEELTLTIRYFPDIETRTRFSIAELKDSRQYERHLMKAWNNMLEKISGYYSNRVRELVKAMGEE